MSESVAARPTAGSPDVAARSPDPLDAELRAGEVTFRLHAAAGQEITLGRHSEDRAYQPDVDLGDLPNGRTVSRRHARLVRQEDEWLLRVEPVAANPTLIGGQRIDPGQTVALRHGDLLQFGGVATVFVESDPVQIVGPELIELQMTPDTSVSVEPGSAASASIAVVNFTDHVDQFLVEVRGLPAEWYRLILNGLEVERAEIPLFQTRARQAPASDAVGRLQVHFKPPRLSSARAGVHPFTIRVTTRARPRLRREIAATLTIAPFEGLAIQQIPTPATRLVADFAWVVSNVGNAPTSVVMTTQPLGSIGEGSFVALPDPLRDDNPTVEDTRVAYAWEQSQVVLDAGRSHHARMRARVRKRHWWGGVIAYRFNAIASAGTLSVADAASIACPPRVPEWLQAIARWFAARAAVLVPLLILLALAWVFFLQTPAVENFRACIGWVPDDVNNAAIVPTEPPCEDLHESGITEGQPIHLTFRIRNAANVNIVNSNFDGRPIGWRDQLSDRYVVHNEAPIKTTTYKAVVQNRLGSPNDVDQTVVVHTRPKIDQFTASTHNLAREGDPVVVTWKVSAEDEEQPTVVIAATGPGGQPPVRPPPGPGCGAGDAPPERINCQIGSGELVHHPIGAETHYQILAWNQHGESTGEQIVVVDPPQIDALAANPSAALAGREVRLQWTARGATRLTLREAPNDKDPGGAERDLDMLSVDAPVRPVQDTWYILTAYNVAGQVSKKIKVSVARPPPPQSIFRAEPDSITRGEPTQLTWQIDNAVQMTIQPGLGSVTPGKGSAVVKPDRDTEYRLTAITSDGKQLTRTARVQVRPGPVVVDFFTSASPQVEKGDSTTLTYSVQNAQSVSIRDATGAVVKKEKAPEPPPAPTPPAGDAAAKPSPPPAILGSVDVTPDKTMVYILTAKNDAGQITQPITIEVKPPKSPTPAAGAAGAAGAAPAGAPAAGAAPAAAATVVPPPPTPAGTPVPPLQATAQAARPPTQMPPRR